jgi:hypothetical protein
MAPNALGGDLTVKYSALHRARADPERLRSLRHRQPSHIGRDRGGHCLHRSCTPRRSMAAIWRALSRGDHAADRLIG